MVIEKVSGMSLPHSMVCCGQLEGQWNAMAIEKVSNVLWPVRKSMVYYHLEVNGMIRLFRM